MCHKLAEHLQRELPQWNVDCEYNRDGNYPKKLRVPRAVKECSVFPDIIVHKRGGKQNILIIEAKCSDSPVTRVNYDVEKLKLYVKDFGYYHAALVTFVVSGELDVKFELNHFEY
jgi:hypothetical protein